MTSGAVITGAGHAFPASASQRDLYDGFFAAHFGDSRAARAAFGSSGVHRRGAVADPLVEDVSSWTTSARMASFASAAPALAGKALAAALASSGVAADELGLLVVASCTGYSTPGVDVRIAADLGLAPDCQRLLVGHAGCHAALPGLAAASDHVRGHGRPAALVCVELSSLHLQPPTADAGQAVVHALFGDAASAVVLEGARPPAATSHPPGGAPFPLAVVSVESRTDTDSAGLMTWEVTDHGFRMGLSRRVPEAVGAAVGPLVDSLLAARGAARRDVAHWAVHPGGPRLLDVVGDRLGLGPDELAHSRAVLAEHGNCSSATLPVVLDRARAASLPGELLVALAFGPGLTLYGCLLECVAPLSRKRR